MSNYVDTRESRSAPPRECTCPGKPHPEDTAEVRVKLGYGELAAMRAAGWARSGGTYFVNEDAKAALIALGVVRWNLVLPDGRPRPVTAEQVELLDEDAIDWLYAALEPAVKRPPLPNGTSGRSPDGSPAKPSPTPTTTAPTDSTTT